MMIGMHTRSSSDEPMRLRLDGTGTAPGRFASVVVESWARRSSAASSRRATSCRPSRRSARSSASAARSIREGLKLLEERGLVRVEQGRGTTVQPREPWNLLDPVVLQIALAYDDDMSLLDNLISVRRVLEREMARERRDTLTDDELAELASESSTEMEASYERLRPLPRARQRLPRDHHASVGQRDRADDRPSRSTATAAPRLPLAPAPPAKALERTAAEHRPILRGTRGSRRRAGRRRAISAHIEARWAERKKPDAVRHLTVGDHSYDDHPTMRIAALDVELITLPAVTPPFAWRRGLRGSHPARTTAVLRITTEDGAVGEAYHEWSGADARRHRRPRPPRRARRRAGRPARVALAPPLGARPDRGVPDLAVSESSTSRCGISRGASSASPCTACSAPTATRSRPTRRRRPSRRSRSSSTSPTSASSSATRRSSCTLGATRGPTPTCASASAPTSGPTST